MATQPKQRVEDQVTYFAETNFRGEHRRFGIRGDDRRRHMYIIGKTGMGKSTMLENMIIQDIQNGNGLAVVDPHGDLVEKVVNFIPSDRINDVIYFNPADMHNPIAFNILEQVDPEYKNLVANGLVGVFKKIWADSWGPRLEYILINSILALLEYPGSTLLGVTRMLVDAGYRKKVVKNITDVVVKQFWVEEFNNYSEKFRNEAIAPIQNKVGQFLSSSLIRNIVGQPNSTIEMREIMDNGKILLMNLSKGRIGEENAALLGAMMITKIQLAAMSRVDVPEPDRRDFYLYVDEFQNFSTESFAGILSEARKYRLDLIMAHQYIEQLSDEVKAAVFGNVGTLLSFRVGATDAEELEKEFAPVFIIDDIVTLPTYHAYLRLMIDGVASQPFSATTLPPLEGETGNAETVINVSRERYANNLEEVEAKIRLWAGQMSEGREESSEGGGGGGDSRGGGGDFRKGREGQGGGNSGGDSRGGGGDFRKGKGGDSRGDDKRSGGGDSRGGDQRKKGSKDTAGQDGSDRSGGRDDSNTGTQKKATTPAPVAVAVPTPSGAGVQPAPQPVIQTHQVPAPPKRVHVQQAAPQPKPQPSAPVAMQPIVAPIVAKTEQTARKDELGDLRNKEISFVQGQVEITPEEKKDRMPQKQKTQPAPRTAQRSSQQLTAEAKPNSGNSSNPAEGGQATGGQKKKRRRKRGGDLRKKAGEHGQPSQDSSTSSDRRSQDGGRSQNNSNPQKEASSAGVSQAQKSGPQPLKPGQSVHVG